MIDYLGKNPGLDAEAPVASTLGGLDGMVVRFRLGPGCETARGDQPLFQVWRLSNGENELRLSASTSSVYEVFVTEVDGEALAVWLDTPEAGPDAFLASARSLLTTLEVVP